MTVLLSLNSAGGLHDSTISNGETIGFKDLVVRQYEQLSYPDVKEDDILNEENYYSAEGNSLSMMHLGITLEKINHYLFQGKESFG